MHGTLAFPRAHGVTGLVHSSNGFAWQRGHALLITSLYARGQRRGAYPVLSL